MLAYVLAVAVGIGSIAIYLAAFFFPEIHKKNDFIWSGVGLFYALVLWIFARRISGGLLLGHIASVSLLYWFGWQAFSLRRQVVPTTQQTPLPSTQEVKATVEQKLNKVSLPQRISQLQRTISGAFSGVKDKAQQTIKKSQPQDTTSATASPTQIIDALTDEAPTTSDQATVNSTIEIKAAEPVDITSTETTETKIAEPIPPNPPSPELVEAAQAEMDKPVNLPVEEIAPDAALAPPAEPPTEQTPPAS
ncbi:MAG: Ycf66 family protein [Calothrix sp. C42_A2020_038]|nr:Ycf66 family protein [Calothrix sp. C42_A2020_038]